jgi:ArsR family metal-binding transcriptional regulator
MYVKNYSDLSLKIPDCHIGSQQWVARFRLDADVTVLFPYINAVSKNAKYFDKPHYIQFLLDEYRCALYPDYAVAAPFNDRDEAVAFIQKLLDFLNDLFIKKGSIEPDQTKYQPLPVLGIYKLLPKTNCAECGFATCMAFAAALSNGKSVPDHCPAIRAGENENALKLRSLLT